MRGILIPVGSAGDVYPFLGLGRELLRRGHAITVITNGYFQGLVRQLGFEFVEYGSAEQYRQVMADPDLWHPTKGFRTVMKVVPPQDAMYEAILQRYEPGRTVVVAHSLAFAARTAQDKTGVAVVSLHLSPILFRTLRQTPIPRGRMDFSGLPVWLKRGLFWLADRYMLDAYAAPLVNDLRARLGLPAVQRIFKEWLHSPLLTVGMFPDWFGPPQPDWPGRPRLTGFPLFDLDGGAELSAEVEQFLCDGPPPIVATPGSANIHASLFFEAIVDACERLDRRGLILTRFPQQLPARLPNHVRHFDFAPLSRLLPRCAALVHHGGIGTTAAGLAAGVPQVIMPMSHDQPDNAGRVRQLGVAATLLPREFAGAAVARTLDRLLGSEGVQVQCRELAERCRRDHAIAVTCDLIEGLFR